MIANPEPPTLDELRAQYERGEFGHLKVPGSRYHSTACPKCGLLITNYPMGRKSRMRMHARQEEQARRSGR